MRFYEILNEEPIKQLQNLLSNSKFQSWFKGSKVVDKTGQPLISYHYSIADFEIISFHQFTHFGTINAASARSAEYDELGQTIPVILSIKNPIRFEDEGTDVDNYFILDLNDQGILSDEEFTEINKQWTRPYSDPNVKSHGYLKFKKTIVDVLKRKGYDGMVYENHTEDDGSDSWIVFDSNQIWNIFSDSPGT